MRARLAALDARPWQIEASPSRWPDHARWPRKPAAEPAETPTSSISGAPGQLRDELRRRAGLALVRVRARVGRSASADPGARAGQLDADRETAERRRLGLHLAAVRVDDQAHDRQAQAGTAGRGAHPAATAERLEQRVDLGVRDDRTAVGDVQPHPLGGLPGRDPQPAVGDVVPDRVLDEVPDQPLEQSRIPCGDSPFDVRLDR